jgi:uncharacterized protein DUF4382
MTTQHGLKLVAALALAASMAGCSSTDQSSTSKGNFRMALKASGTTTAAATTGAGSGGEGNGITAANITISGASARNADGTWVPVNGSFPVTIDVIALAMSGGTRTLPPDVLPAGHYTAIQITITSVDLTLHDGTKIAITPPGTGWEVVIPATFDVVAGQETIVSLNLHCDHSFSFMNGEFEFDPEIDVDDVEHDD